ncbi:CLF1 [Candida margitis]|uniref:CLF1 n=1 Tax=Candida margitis TaxID=1775924 RepID=UPI002225FA08|nr:CLF1 [Candida margitis]KAI5970418.1 CLF1 [Candida margitis]
METKHQLIFEDTTTKLSRPKQTIQDLDELYLNQQTKRKEFEQQLNKNRLNYGQWLRYARWELDHNHDFARARSIMERALDVDIEHIPFWTQYIQFELIHKNVNHARNLLERATSALPKVNKLWFLYVQTEEMLKNYQMVRQIFEKWLTWHPDESAWDAYIYFETRYDEVDNVRDIYQRYIQEYSQGEVWLKWINYELQNNEKDIEHVRAVFESAVDSILERNDEKFPEIVAQWLSWEVKCMEYDRVKMIRKLLLDETRFSLTTKIQSALYDAISEIERQVGDKNSIEESITLQRKARYKQDIEDDSTNYDSWWSYIDIVEQNRERDAVRQVFKDACRSIPQDTYKSNKWRKFVMLWIRYAFWEEFDNNDTEAAKVVWNECLSVIPHKQFTSGKVWIGLAEFELRNDVDDGLTKFRKVMGRALGQMNKIGPKKNILNYYIATEKKLAEWDRVRQIYQKWLECALMFEQSCNVIVKEYLEFESSLGETGRCEFIFKIVNELMKNEDVSGACFDQREIFDMAVAFYTDEMKYDEIRKLYRDLVTTNPSADNWVSFALFESTIPTVDQLETFLQSNKDTFEVEVGDEQIGKTRDVFKEAESYFKKSNDTDGRKFILEAWKLYELTNGDEESVEVVNGKQPKRVKKRRTVDGIEEEYFEWEFPVDPTDQEPPTQTAPSINKFLANARKWAESNH